MKKNKVINLDVCLNFLYLTIKNNLLEDNFEIEKISLNNEIENKNIVKKKTKIKKSLIQIDIESSNKLEKLKLLILDLPINFIIFKTILIGDEAKLFKFKFKNNEEITFIAEKNVLDLIKEKTIIKTHKEINPKELQSLKFNLNFEQPKKITEFKNFILKNNKIDLNKIHLIKSNKIELAIPNIKKYHFKIFRSLKLPLIQIFNNGFIEDTTINIFDIEEQIKKIKPIEIFEEEIIWDFEKDKNIKLYKDIRYNIWLKINQDKIIKIIQKSKFSNFNKYKIIKEINKINRIKISTNNRFELNNHNQNNNIPLPIFKSIKNQNFIKIKNTKDFLKLTGIKFKLDEEYLKNILILTLKGEKLKYINLFLNPKIEKIIEKISNIEINHKINIEFENIKELILKIIYFQNLKNLNDFNNQINNINEEVNKIKKKEIKEIKEIKENMGEEINSIIYIKKSPIEIINQIKNLIKKILKKNILQSIKLNKIPTETFDNTITKKYYNSIYNSIYKSYVDFFEKKISIGELNELTKEKLNNTFNSLKNGFYQNEEIYFINKIILISIFVLELNEKNSAEDIFYLFSEFYLNYKNKNLNKRENLNLNNINKKNLNLKLMKSKINPELELELNLIFKASNLFKKNREFIIIEKKYLLKEKNDDENILKKELIEFIKKIDLKEYFINEFEINKKLNFKYLIKANKKYIREIFKYSSEKIIEKINSLNIDEIISNDTINLENKNIKINPEMIKIHKKINDYKKILESKYFELIIPKK